MLLEELRRDAARYEKLGGWHRRLGFWIGATYRVGVWAHALRNPLLRVVIVTLYRMVRLPWYLFLQVDLSSKARIGPGLCLIHPNNVLVPRGVEIGEDCLLFHDVTLGTGPLPGLPKLGNRVDVYVGARVLGGVRVGDRSMVGANCVVTRHVPPDSAILPVPTRVLRRSLLARAHGAGGDAAGARAPAPVREEEPEREKDVGS
ncbi:serine acetyltransferase [Anaeromyxobacter oryzae]|uniref:Serine acetyltransferase n=1 Tax=Anaeromyxobacter oryzae TaxID=2918170 RepID=A0ABN6MUK8_9BACT|nr:serine acetyltransferase [Anaeromyxobacter oryzae]BDG04628.1 hypothetical protein AMOR_36240 [Anaeromyxobacter oryzae]